MRIEQLDKTSLFSGLIFANVIMFTVNMLTFLSGFVEIEISFKVKDANR